MGMVQPVLNKNEISKNFTNILILLVIVFWSDLETLETSNDFFFPFSIHLWDSFNSLKFLIYKIYIFHSPSIWFSIKKKRFDVSNVSSLIFLISLLFTIFYLFVWRHFNIFFFLSDSSSFSFSRFTLFTFYTYSIDSLYRLLVTKRRRSSWKSALFRRTLTTGNPGNLIHRETKSTISMTECVLFARISKNSRESALRNW